MDKTAIFNENCKSLEDVVVTYETATNDKLAAVLRLSVYEKMLSKMQQKNTGNDESLVTEYAFQSTILKRHSAGIYGLGTVLTVARNKRNCCY